MDIFGFFAFSAFFGKYVIKSPPFLEYPCPFFSRVFLMFFSDAPIYLAGN